MNKIVFLNLLLFAAFSCGPFPDSRIKLPADLNPPVFTQIVLSGAETIEVQFDENISVAAEYVQISPALAVRETRVEAHTLFLTVDEQSPGSEYNLEMVVEDLQHNSANILICFYGYNPRVPGMLINEFITNGSSTHPDLVELKVLAPGNLGGVVLYQGTPSSCQDRFIFPVLEAKAGDFILVHFKPQNISLEINEVSGKTESGGLDASENAFDFWVKGGSGLSGNNGVLSLYANPAGALLDGVLYSNRTSASDEKYLGFGTAKVMERALELASAGGWVKSGEVIAPEDGVNPDTSTSTRSLCRCSSGTDTNTKGDWHIVPSRMSTFGNENADDVF